MVSYALGNKNDVENDIKVIGEDLPNVITYSRSLTVVLSKFCRNNCPYCGFKKNDTLIVPYATIRAAKQARQNGAREALLVAGERPDRSPYIRSVLDLWGFNSYTDYLYTVAELLFLEGLIPVFDIGFLTPQEMQRLSEITAIFKIMLDGIDINKESNFYSKSPGKRHAVRFKSLIWAGKLNVPTSTGFIVGLGESEAYRKVLLQEIADIHKEYGNIHEVLLQNFIADPRASLKNITPPSKEEMLSVARLAKEILPDDIHLVIPVESNPDIADFIGLGIRDLGRITEGPNIYMNPIKIDFTELKTGLEQKGYTLQQRFPLHLNYIKESRYSKKLGQVFDAYRYKIKKEEVEKLKDAKLNANENKKQP